MDGMEKRTLLALGLSLVVLYLWTAFLAPQPAPPAAPAGPPPPETALAAPGEVAAPVAAEPAPELEPQAAEAAEEVVVRTDLYEVTLTNRGARVVSWRLLAYANDEGEPVELIPPDAGEMDRLPLSVWLPGRDDLGRRANESLFAVARERLSPGPEGGAGERLVFRFADASGFAATKSLEFRDGSYWVPVAISVVEGGWRQPAWLSWGAGFGETSEGADRGHSAYLWTGGAVLDRGGRVSRYQKEKQTTEERLDGATPILWAGMETTYFAALMIPPDPVTQAALLPQTYRAPPPPGKDKEEERNYLSLALAPGGDPASGPSAYTLFVGPKDYHLLREQPGDLAAVINFGWPVVREIAQILYLALTWIYGYIGNYGIAIILLTIVIRVGFFPLIYRSQIRMRQMQRKTKRIQPKMKAIRERYRKARGDMNSRQRMNEEIMELYRKEGINPLGGLGGCLPIVIQLPFLYGFYQLLRAAIELRHAPFFGWIHDLSQPDPYYVTPLLMGVTMLVQTKISMSSVVDPAQRRMMTLMTVMFTVFFLNLPSGLVVYWLFSNLLGIGQQILVNRNADQEAEAAKPRRSRKERRAEAASGN